jgi:glycosyltransferase involved in cell wall biosynthesis
VKIAFVSTMGGTAWGGSEELWAAAARRAAERGHEVLASLYDHGVVPPQVKALMDKGVRVVWRRRPTHSRIDARLAPLRLRFRAVAAFRPDVVCVSQGESYDVALHGACEELRAWMAATRVPNVIISQLNYEAIPVSPAARRKIRETFAGASSVAFVSERNLRQARRHLAWDVPNGVVVRNPVNLASTDEVAWPASAGSELSAAGVARLDTGHKGQDALLEALSDPAWRPRSWGLDLYGAGPDEAYLRDLIAYYGLGERVRLRGHAQDVRSIWASHHLLALPSRHEGTPLSMVEAMLCARACMVTDVAGNTEWTREGENGFVAESALPPALNAAMTRAWEARGRLRELGRAARALALGQIDPDPGATVLGLVERAAGATAAAAQDAATRA